MISRRKRIKTILGFTFSLVVIGLAYLVGYLGNMGVYGENSLVVSYVLWLVLTVILVDLWFRIKRWIPKDENQKK